MKKLISMLLVVALAVTCFTTVAFAAGSASVSGSSVTAEAGDTVTLSFTVSGGFMTYDMTLVPDSGLSIEGFSGVEDNDIGVATWYSNNGENVDKHSFEVTVKVSDDATPGTYNLTPDVAYVSDRDLNDLDVSVSAGKVIIEAPAHEHSWSEWKTTKEATCTEDGLQTRTCDCGEVEEKVIPAKGHDYEAVVTAPDCENKGYTTYTCKNDPSHTYKADYVDALGHAWGEWVTVKEATETEDGLMQRTCANCGEVEEKIIPAKGHEHKGEWKVVKEATCTEDGLEQLICGCGEVLDEKVIPALGHTYDKNDYEYDEDEHWHVCDRCGEEVDHEDHVFNKHNGLCECGYKDPTWKPAVDPDDDDLPKTGDITPYITFTAAALISMVAAAGYVLKRKFVK